MGLNDNLLLY